jgi:oxalate decarboxylase/phosphoglucose isomerase-like protein (cupin superfamily)
MPKIHRYIVQATEEEFVDTAHYVPDGPIEVRPDDDTVTQTLLNSHLVEDCNVTFALARVPRGSHHLRHYHPHGSEIYFVTTGSCTVFLGEEEIEAKPGMAIYIPPGMVHGDRNDGEETCEMVIVCSTPTYAEMGLVYI